MFLEVKRNREHEVRVESNRETARGYHDDSVGFARGVDLRARPMGSASAGGKACTCGLCCAVLSADLNEVVGSAHLAGGPACGCGRCQAVTTIVDQLSRPGPG